MCSGAITHPCYAEFVSVHDAAGEQGGVLQSVDVEASLSPDARWQASRFLALEQYMLKFLTGAGINRCVC